MTLSHLPARPLLFAHAPKTAGAGRRLLHVSRDRLPEADEDEFYFEDLIGMPVYVILAVTLMNTLPRLPLWAEVPVYILLGVAWILPFKALFKGIGQPDPDQK